MIKVTFTLDDDTVAFLKKTAERLGMPRSQVVREAIRVYGERAGELSSAERAQMLAVLDELGRAVPDRPRADVERELEALRRARRTGGRLEGGPG